MEPIVAEKWVIGLLGGFGGALLIFSIGFVERLISRRNRVRGIWEAIFVEIDICGDHACTYLYNRLSG